VCLLGRMRWARVADIDGLLRGNVAFLTEISANVNRVFVVQASGKAAVSTES